MLDRRSIYPDRIVGCVEPSCGATAHVDSNYNGQTTRDFGETGNDKYFVHSFESLVPLGTNIVEAYLEMVVTNGTAATTFSRQDPVTRAQMAAFLWRLACEQAGSPPAGFGDVPAGAFYTPAVDWLRVKGVTTGTTATTFSPADPVNRAQMAAFLWRLAGSPAGSPDSGFADVPRGEFYKPAVDWLKVQGITTGTSATAYSPNDVVTRAQMATFLYRLAQRPPAREAFEG